MNLVAKSKKLSWLLRHGAQDAGIAMDAAGWAEISEVLATVRMSRTQLDTVVAENNKSRLEVVGERIRCSQGHSLETMPVTLDALEASWTRSDRTEPLWHGTDVKAAKTILSTGVKAMRRSHVHLAHAPDSRVGKRAGVAVLLEVDPQRLDGVWVSSNGVWLTRFVPPSALVGLKVLTRRAREAESELRARLKASTAV